MPKLNVEQRLQVIEARNGRVEVDKAWETSATRKILIVAVTYGFSWLFLFFISVPKPHLNALIPTFGFLFSTLSVGFIKRYWMKRFFDGS